MIHQNKQTLKQQTMEAQEKVQNLFIQMVKAEMAISGNDWNKSKIVVKQWMKEKGLM